MMSRYAIVLLVGLLTWPVESSLAQFSDPDQKGGEQPGLIVDHVEFYEPAAERVRLEVYCQFYNYLLQWPKQGDQFTAHYELTIRVRDDDGRQVDSYSKDREVTVADEARTRSRSDFRTNQANFLLEPGKYQVALTLRDKNSDVTLVREFEVKLKNMIKSKPTLSEIEFVVAASQQTDDSSVFDKGNLRVVPSVSREYSYTADSSRLLYYLEIYRGRDKSDQVFVETAVRRHWGSMVYRDSMTIPLEEPVTRQLRQISTDSLAPGDYYLEVRLRGRRHRELDKQTTSFTIDWSEEALLKHDYSSTLDLLSYIAEPKEISDLKKLTTYQERLKGLNEFWKRRDPTPGTEENEVRREFFRRVRLANRSFSFMRQPGWRTDRGRIYIKHGEPDQIDDYPFAPNSHPYQEWHYYRSGRYRQFTFVDENEDGDYRLVYPYDGLYLRPDF